MKIKKLRITNYKNLNADLVHNSDLIAFIGNNASGKSNLLEAISYIFRSLYVPKYKIKFDYSIEYETYKNSKVTIEKSGKEIKYYLNDIAKNANEIDDYLPQKIVAIYSGEENRLFDDCFKPFYKEFINNINSSQSQVKEYSNLPKMLFLNKFYWNLSLLSLLISESPDNKNFIANILKIEELDKVKVKIGFNSDNYKKYNDNSALRLVKTIDAKTEYTLKDFKQLLVENGYIADDIFKYLYLAYTPKDSKIINYITIEFSDNLTVSDLSEGEKKLLLIKGALEFAGQEDSIFILDEPDAHIHINNKEQITNSFTDYLGNRQIIITTHSPTLTQCVKDENVYMLNSGKIIDSNRQDIIEEVTGEFWNKHQQNSFMSSKKDILLLVEGKHDKEHINNAFAKLKDEYTDLSFDIFNMTGADNIPQLITGLRTSDLNLNKLIIGIFDNDDKGRDNCNKTRVKYDLQSKPKSNGFYAIKYENDQKFKNGFGFTVENMFEPHYFENAYICALNEFKGKFKNKFIDEISENIKDGAKRILSKNSKNFTKEDFKYFRKLFDLITEIKEHSDSVKNNGSKVKPQPQAKNAVVTKAQNCTVSQKISAKDDHLAYWTAFKDFIQTQRVSFKLQTPKLQNYTNIAIGSGSFRIRISTNRGNQCISIKLVCVGKNALVNFQKLKSTYETDSKQNLSSDLEWKENIGKIEPYIDLLFANNNIFDKTQWNNQHQLLSDWTEKFYNYFKDKIRAIKP